MYVQLYICHSVTYDLNCLNPGLNGSISGIYICHVWTGSWCCMNHPWLLSSIVPSSICRLRYRRYSTYVVFVGEYYELWWGLIARSLKQKYFLILSEEDKSKLYERERPKSFQIWKAHLIPARVKRRGRGLLFIPFSFHSHGNSQHQEKFKEMFFSSKVESSSSLIIRFGKVTAEGSWQNGESWELEKKLHENLISWN